MLKSLVFYFSTVAYLVASVTAVIDQNVQGFKRQSTDRLVFSHFMVKLAFDAYQRILEIY